MICGGAHALHDGLTDLLNVLYPLLQAQFGLSYAAIGALKAVYSGAMASGQIPSGWLAGNLYSELFHSKRQSMAGYRRDGPRGVLRARLP